MSRSLADLSRRLADRAESVCRHYLSNGRRSGNYWIVGDVYNNPGQSMFVRLKNTAQAPAGRWTDAATGQYGDLLDVLREQCAFVDIRGAAEEARKFLRTPDLRNNVANRTAVEVRVGSREAARRLIAISRSIRGTLAERYLADRSITGLGDLAALRFHPRCYYFAGEDRPPEAWPALVAIVTDHHGLITGAHRTWLDPDGFNERRLGKAPVDTPRRAMGDLLGNAVRFGPADDVMAVGEGIESVLSIKCALPTMPVAAALSAAHLPAVQFPKRLRRLYIAQDGDRAGMRACDTLAVRASAAGIEAFKLLPQRGDFNDDLRLCGVDALRAGLKPQLAATDVGRFVV